MNDAAAFLALWHGHGQPFALWTPKVGRAHFYTDPAKAIKTAAEWDGHGENVYLSCGAFGTPTPTAGRGKAVDIVLIPGVWLDIDVAGPHRKRSDGLFETIAEARVWVEQWSKPTILVNSGGGLHAYWLFKTPLLRRDGDIEANARNHVERAQAACPYRLDAVGDVARILRLPDTIHQPTGQPVRVEYMNDLRFSPEMGHSPERPQAARDGVQAPGHVKGRQGTESAVARTGDDVRTALACLDKIGADRAQDYDSWLRVGMILHSVDPSPIMLAAWDHWSRGADSYAEGSCPEKWASFADPESRNGRVLTIATLVKWAGDDTGGFVLDRLDAEVPEEGPVAQVDGDHRERILTELSEVLAVRVLDIVQRGTERSRVEYFARLSGVDGLSSIGTEREMLRGPETFEHAVVATQRRMLADRFAPGSKGRIKDWRRVVGHILRIAKVEETPENTLAGIIYTALEGFLGGTPPLEYAPEVVEAGRPFRRDGCLWLKAQALRTYSQQHGDPVTAAMLRACGWTRKAVSFRTSDGRVASSSYFHVPTDSMSVPEGMRAVIM